MLPAGCARLATQPSATGSLAVAKTIGIVVLVAFAASAAGVLVAAMTAPDGEPVPQQAPAGVRSGFRPSDIRRQHSGLRRSPSRSGHVETHVGIWCRAQAPRHSGSRRRASIAVIARCATT